MKNSVVRDLRPVEQEIVEKIAKMRTRDGRLLVVLEGGYFTTTHGADEFTIQSQRSVLRIAGQLKRMLGDDIRIVFGVLGNDLGQVCASDASVCRIDVPNEHVPAKIPDELQDELDKYPNLRAEQLVFLTERRARNRGIKYFQNYYRQNESDIRKGLSHLVVAEQDGDMHLYFKASDGQETAVAQKRAGRLWSSYCPLIMAQHYADVSQRARKLYSRTDSLIVVDLSFIEDRHKVTKGAELALQSYPHMGDVAILNVCFGDDEGELYTIDEHRLAELTR